MWLVAVDEKRRRGQGVRSNEDESNARTRYDGDRVKSQKQRLRGTLSLGSFTVPAVLWMAQTGFQLWASV